MKFQKSRYRVCHAILSMATLTSPLAASAAELFLYSGRDFTGSTARVDRSEGRLAIGTARSIRVETGVWEVCTGQNFSGDCRRLTAGDYRELGDRYADTVQSVRDVTYAQPAVTYTPARLQVFDARDFRGRTNTIEQNVADFDQGRNPIGSPASAIVTGGTWEICTDYNFGGRCQALPPGRYNDLGAQLNYRIVSARVLDQPRPQPLPAPPPPTIVQVDPLAAIIGAIAGGVIANSGNNNSPAPYPLGPSGGRARVDVYADVDFRGQALTLNDDVDNLRNSGLNDRIQSMRVSGGNWEACEDRNYGGSCMVFGPGEYRRLPPQMDQSISSVRRVGGGDPNWSGLTPGGQNYTMMDANAPRSRHPVWLYADSNFRGNTLRAVGDVADLGSSGMNDKASSIFISLGNWQFCEDSNYRGQCFILGPGQYSDVPQGMNDQISSFRRVR